MHSNRNNMVDFIWRSIRKTEIPMKSPNVIESIGDDYINWHPKNPIFIDAPTGSGKTTFVYQKLIRNALSQNKSVLLVSNRIALSLQQKKAIIGLVREYAPHSLTDIPTNASSEDIKKLAFIGPVCVATYQGLFSLLNAPLETHDITSWIHALQYAIFDEIHFLYSDALFNPMCGHLLQKLPVVFNKVIRIYMTATSWDVTDSILRAERFIRYTNSNLTLSHTELQIANLTVPSTGKYTLNRHLFYYYRKADYSSYRLHFFDGSNSQTTDNTKRMRKKYLVSLLNEIIPTASPTNKWLILVDKRNSGDAIMRLLTKEGIQTAYVDAKIKKPKETWEQLIRENKFDTSVLIATAVIDSGVNVVDETVKNIAILCTDHTSFIQLIGRKRCAPEEVVDLWVWLPDKDYFKHMADVIISDLKRARNLIAGLRLYHQEPSIYARAAKNLWEHKKNIRYPALFYVDGHTGLFNVNYYVYGILKQRLNFLLNFVKTEKPLQFQDVIEEWLGIPGTLAPSMQVKPVDTPRSTADLSTLLDNNIDTKLSDDAFKPIRRAILAAQPDTMDYYIRPERRENCSAKTLNTILEYLKLPYFIKKQAKLWTISRIQSEN